MKEGWEIKKLGDIILENKKSILKSKGNKEGIYPFFISGMKVKSCNKNIIDGQNIFLPTGGNFYVHFYEGKASYSTDTWSIKTNKNVDIKYFYFFLLLNKDYINEKYFKGATIKHLQKNDFKAINIPLPLFSEQKQISSTLDELFAAFKKTNNIIEKNLKNVNELYISYLQNIFENKGEDWEERTLGEVAKHTLGKMLDKNKNQGTPQKYLRNQSVRWFDFNLNDLTEMPFLESEKDKYTAVKGDVLICEGGYPGRAAIWKENYAIYFQKALHRVRFHRKEYNEWFLYYLFFLDKTDKLKTHFTGTAIQHFTGQALDKLRIPLPPIKEVTAIIAKIHVLSNETKRLEAIYQKKLDDLEELKKSILQKAFSGELNLSIKTTKVISLPLTIKDISTTDLQAGIVAIALQKHLQQGKENTFHHVKTEKIIHLSEAILNIDLERNPYKDAAGPNDFTHAKKVEARALKAGFFSVQKINNLYEYKPGSQIQKLVDKTKAALNEKTNQLIELIDFMVPMTTQQAEIVATVYAAWNNLLIDNTDISDEAIVTEARENWHPDKLKISREKFFNALTWMKQKDIFVPKGEGKKVLPKILAKSKK